VRAWASDLIFKEFVSGNAGSGLVIREITDLIERCEFIICDLTNERLNVYYELGYAHGVGNEAREILLIAKEGKAIVTSAVTISKAGSLGSELSEPLHEPAITAGLCPTVTTSGGD
jgi:hypothetical protein